MNALFSNPIFGKPVVNLVMLAVLLAALFGLGLGERPYSTPSESRYIEIGREMAESGDFVTPRLDYVKYFEKPPLFYWIQAEMTKHFELDAFAVRVPTALFAIAFCLLTYALGELLYGRLAGWLGALTLATSLYMFALSRVVLVDVPVSVFLVATLYFFLYAVRAPDGRCRTVALYAMYVAAACAVLTKGLIGAVLPGIIVFIWLALTRNWKILSTFRLPGGLALFLLIAVPWHILVSLRNPEFPHFYFIHEHLERYLTKAHGRYQPDWFFLVVFAAGLFPWTMFTPQALHSGLRGFWNARFRDGSQLFLLIWGVFILFFFSLSDSKLIPYILPIFPPVGVFMGRYFADAWQEKPVEYFRTGLVFMVLLLLAMTVAPTVMPRIFDQDSKVMEAVTQAKDDIDNLSILSIIAAGALLITCIQGQKRHLIVCLIVVAATIMQAGDRVAQHYNKDSMADIVGAIKFLGKPGDEVVAYDEYYQDLPVYLGRKVTVVGWGKTELNFGASHENTSAWMIDNDEFWRRWLKNDHLMFAVMRDDVYKSVIQGKKPEDFHLYDVTHAGRNILLTNQISKAR